MKNLFLLFSIILFTQCKPEFDRNLEPVMALSPIYTNIEKNDNLFDEPKEYNILNDAILYQDKLLILEKYYGVHVIDNSNNENPINTGFIKLAGITSFTIQNDYLIGTLANHIITTDLRINNFGEVTAILEVEESAIGLGQFPFDEDFKGAFECVDLSKGIVSAWEEKEVVDPKCMIH